MLGASVVYAADTPANALLVLAKRDGMLLIVDPSSLHVIARVPVGNDPHEVIASTDGKTAYASNYGGGAYNTLAVVDLVAQKALPAVDLGPLRGPHGLVFVGRKGVVHRRRLPRPLAATILRQKSVIGFWAPGRTGPT